jgi:hypothetical protein
MKTDTFEFMKENKSSLKKIKKKKVVIQHSIVSMDQG